MESYILDWLNLLLRWFHLIAGAAWIGASFYFNWLNHSIRPPEDEGLEGMEGIKGQLFAVHGGAFYQVLKYKGAPAKLPKTLHWFMWEAYSTWLSGFGLVIVVYYWNAKLYLIKSGANALVPWQAILISLGFIVGGWLIYDFLCKTPLPKKSPVLFVTLGFALISVAAFALSYIYPPRASYIHVGVILGTIMAANVFFVIIPKQRVMVNAMIEGKEPDVTAGEAGAMRSLHNNYFTLPVLFIMISNHFPMTYGHKFNWIVLLAISVIGAGVRHYFNLKHKGHYNVWVLPVAAVAMFSLAFVIRPVPKAASKTFVIKKKLAYGDVASIIQKRCVPCHASKPTYPGFTAPPQGSKFEAYQEIVKLRAKMLTNVKNSVMPPGNLTGLTDRERAYLVHWLDHGAPEK